MIEKELEKYQNGEAYDPSVLADVIKKSCLGDYFTQENIKSNCRHYWAAPEEKLSATDRINLLELKKNKIWRVVTLIISVVAIIISLLSIYLKD